MSKILKVWYVYEVKVIDNGINFTTHDQVSLVRMRDDVNICWFPGYEKNDWYYPRTYSQDFLEDWLKCRTHLCYNHPLVYTKYDNRQLGDSIKELIVGAQQKAPKIFSV